MKQFSSFLNVILGCVLGFSLAGCFLPGRAAFAADNQAASVNSTASLPVECDSGRTIQVSGTAAVNVVPDRVLIQLGVQSNGTTTDSVQAANTSAIQRVTAALQASGVASRDIATDWYIIEPLYDDYDSLYIKGYRINNIVAVTLRDISRTSSLIAAAIKAGANQVVNVEFYTSELRKYRDQARDLAMKAAAEKASALAGSAGAQAGCVLHISENSWSYYNGGWYGRNQSLWTQNSVQNASPSGSESALSEAGPVSLGQISIQAQVEVTYNLK